MSIGTSKGSFYEDGFHAEAGINTDPSMDNNVIDPDVDPEGMKPKPQPTTVPTPIKLTLPDNSEKPGPDIEDRREDPQQFLPGLKASVKNFITDSLPAGIAQKLDPIWTQDVPETGMSKDLGSSNIKAGTEIGDAPINSAVRFGQDLLNTSHLLATAGYHLARGSTEEEINKSWDTQEKRTPYSSSTPIEDIPFSSGTKFGNRLFGLGGEERYQLWPERMVREALEATHQVATGQINGWKMNPDTGEFHTSPEMLAAADKLMPFVMSGMTPTRIHLNGVPEKLPTERAPSIEEVFAQNPRLRNQPSNIVEHPDSLRQTPFTDHMSDEEFLRYGEMQQPHSMSAAEETRWARLDREEGGPGGQEPFSVHSYDARDAVRSQSYAEELRAERISSRERQAKLVVDSPTVASKGDIALKDMKETAGNDMFRGGEHRLGFMNGEGKTGVIDISTRNSGKMLYVDWIGGAKGDAINEFGKKGIRDLLLAIKEHFPKAEEISGFRVSGARQDTARGPAKATLRLRPRSNMPEPSNIEPIDFLPPRESPSWHTNIMNEIMNQR